MQKIKEFWFLVSLILISAAVVIDRTDTLAGIGIYLKSRYASEIIIFLIFIASGLLIEKDQITVGIKDIRATFFTLLIILVVSPAAALLLSFLPLETGVVIGLFLVAVMPTTLSSGVVMTGVAGGNMAHALFLTIISNVAAIFSIPLILSWLLLSLDHSKSFAIDQGAMILKLTLLVLVPLMMGIYIKSFVCKILKPDKLRLQIANQCLVIFMVYISFSGAKQVLMGKGIQIFYVVLLAIVFHLVLLGSAFLLVKIFSIKKGSFESVIFMGSQKTLPLSIMIQLTYFGEFGSALLVCVMHHIVHLMIDGYLSTKLGEAGLEPN